MTGSIAARVRCIGVILVGLSACRPTIDVTLEADWYAGIAVDTTDGRLVDATPLGETIPRFLAERPGVANYIVGFSADQIEPLGPDAIAGTLVEAQGCAVRFPRPTAIAKVLDGNVAYGSDDPLPPVTVEALSGRCSDGYACVGNICEERVRELAAGNGHVCARWAGGRVSCWGRNDAGETGLPWPSFDLEATLVVGIDDATAIAVGWHHSCAIRTDRTVWCWGSNDDDQLGDPTRPSRESTPGPVPGIVDAVAIAAHGFHTCVIVEGGEMYCFGSNSRGELGDGTDVRRTGPVRSLGVANVERLALGIYHTCAGDSDGVVKCFGADLDPLLTPFVAGQIDAGDYHTCAVVDDGGVLCFGLNRLGSVADGGFDPGGAVVDIALGGDWGCVTLDSGAVKCWGTNDLGQRRIASLLIFELPRPMILPGVSNVRSLVLDNDFACYLDSDQHVRCWGWNGQGELGRGYRDAVTTPRRTELAGVATTAGRSHTCVLSTRGEVSCFGASQQHQLGDGRQAVRAGPTPVAQDDVLSDVAQISAGLDHTCARKNDGTVHCWGDNRSYQLGASDVFTSAIHPIAIDDVRQISAGGYHTCAVRSNAGEVWCWGANDSDQMGFDSGGRSFIMPVRMPNVTSALEVSSGRYATCVRFADRVRCFGDVQADTTITTLDAPTAIATGRYYACAIERTGTVACWGRNNEGMLGDGTEDPRNTPVRIEGLTDIVELSAGASHACGRTSVGVLYCWGDNNWFQQGDGTTTDHLRPVRVEGVDPVRQIGTGESHTCVVDVDGGVWCWGLNASGQAGLSLGPVDAEPGLVLGLP